jgi:GTP pyrophosphokinase
MDTLQNTSMAHPADEPIDIDAWVDKVSDDLPPEKKEAIRKAAVYAIKAHKSQTRASGEPYVTHAFAVAEILHSLNLDHETICAAILHDVVEDTNINLDDIEKEFGSSVRQLVDGVTKMDFIHEFKVQHNTGSKKDWANTESLRKLLLAMVEDVRVVLMKLADRLHNMRTLKHLPEDKRKRIAKETLDIFSPLANRMGIWQLKWELEDLSLRYLEPETYKKIAVLLDERRVDREQYISNVVKEVKEELEISGIEAEVSGRPKHIYSIWKKMYRKGVDFSEVFDVRAVRIIVNNIADCYAALGIVHTLWQHIPKEFDDYITTPKGNMYQSLHTAVIGPEGRTLEVQIRTREMHEHAELGVAAHWRYKEGGKFDAGFEQKIAWLRQILEWKEEEAGADDFINRFKAEVLEDRVYVITPNGNVVDLPKGATPLDFAYYIHTDVGNKCRGAKINGRIVPLTYELNNGEQVEILTTKNGSPSRDWLNPNLGYLNTSRARAKARTWFKHQDLDKNISAGRAVLDRELHRLGVSNLNLENLASRYHFPGTDEYFAAIGRGEITPTQIADAVQEQVSPEHTEVNLLRETRYREIRDIPGDVKIQGVGNLLTNIARCCKPAPNDPIVGYITRGRGVTIHRSDCPNMLRLRGGNSDRCIEVSWSSVIESTYPVDIFVLAYDRQGLLKDISIILSNEKINVIGVNTITDVKDHMARMTLTLEVGDIGQLSKVLGKINQLSNVVECHRKT